MAHKSFNVKEKLNRQVNDDKRILKRTVKLFHVHLKPYKNHQ